MRLSSRGDYPIEVLPQWLQTIAWYNPVAHIFEGMRIVLNESGRPLLHLAWATALNMVYLTLMIGWFNYMFSVCRERGLLVRIGE